MRRKQGTLLPIEISILESGIELYAKQVPEFYGFLIAKQLTEREGARKLTAYGTLYKALSRMENQGLLTSRWEDPNNAAAGGRPRRRLYQVTQAGQDALMVARSNVGLAASARRQELMTS
jgi:DNA-binding PadR family transcriptional regulator